jgi:hypothetical protein
MTTFILTAGISVALAALLCLLFYRLVVAGRVFQIDASWWGRFSPNRYRPMRRLLNPEEFGYLRSLAGRDPALVAECRRNRVQVFQGYLRELIADFGRLQALGQLLVGAGSATETLREELFRQKVRFTVSVWRVRWELLVFRLGLGDVDVTALLSAVQASTMVLRRQPALAGAL